MNRAFLKELLATPSVSGWEEAIQEKALSYGKAFAGAQLTDPVKPDRIKLLKVVHDPDISC